MSKVFSNKIIKFFVDLIYIFILLIIVAWALIGKVGFSDIKFLIIPALGVITTINLYHSKQYIFLLLFGLLPLLSILTLKSFILEMPIRMEYAVKLIMYSVGIVNLEILLSSFFSKKKIRTLFLFMLLILSFVPVMVVWGYYAITSSWLNAEAVLAILQTNASECYEYLLFNFDLISWLVFIVFIFITYYIISFNFRSLDCLNWNKSKLLIIFAIALNVFSIYRGRDNVLTQIFVNTNNYIQEFEKFNKIVSDRKLNVENLKFTYNKDDEGIYVLVIGESQNKNHLSAYGYKRETTPWLDAMQDNLLKFTNAYSCHVQTVPSLAYALTTKNQYNNLEFSAALSVVDIANAADYETFWISNQTKFGFYDTPTTVIASQADHQVWLNDNVSVYYDEKILDSLKNINFNKKSLVVIHLMGSHANYEERYPNEFNKFTENSIIDRYDNSILYTDFIIKSIYEEISKNKNFKAIVYFSDHGEGVDKGLAHDPNKYVIEMAEIPFYMLLSDDYMIENDDKVLRLKNSQDKYFTNDLIFNTVLSLMNIKINGMYEAENDISSQQYDSNPERFRTLYGKKGLVNSDKVL